MRESRSPTKRQPASSARDSLTALALSPPISRTGRRSARCAALVAGVASGELVTAIALTEPGTGSELASITITARRDGDGDGDSSCMAPRPSSGTESMPTWSSPPSRPTRPKGTPGMSLLMMERGIPASSAGATWTRSDGVRA